MNKEETGLRFRENAFVILAPSNFWSASVFTATLPPSGGLEALLRVVEVRATGTAVVEWSGDLEGLTSVAVMLERWLL